ncbi:hypothetical protein [Actinomadura formosensis]|uniref:hypothetical protein n=1 Tax=Actinomadura formosensis TaxID=60706 RepID=UPI003D8A4353
MVVVVVIVASLVLLLLAPAVRIVTMPIQPQGISTRDNVSVDAPMTGLLDEP